MVSNRSIIKVLLLIVVLGYSIDSKSAYRLAQDKRSLVIQLSDIGSDAVLFMEAVRNTNDNSGVCNRFLQPFFIFYNRRFIPFMQEHRMNRFNNLTQEYVDALKSQFDFTQYVWNNCVSHSKEISDPSQLDHQISEDNINFVINRLREHGITEEALDVLRQIFDFQQALLSSDNVECQDMVHRSYTDMMRRYNLVSILLINRGQRSQVIEERARLEFNAVKTEWDICTN